MSTASPATTAATPAAASTSPAAGTPATPVAPVAPVAADAAKPPSAEALAVAQLVRLRYPGALDDEQFKSLTEDLDSRLESGRALRKLSFTNGDEPDLTFHV